MLVWGNILKAILLIAVTIVAAAISLAHAQDIPRYDVSAYCNQVADVSGGSSVIYNGCIDLEQDAYDDLKVAWPSIAPRSLSYCNDVAQISGGSYVILQGCIDMETDAASSTPEFKY